MSSNRTANDNFVPSLQKDHASDDFFTDSLLDPSRIPTPSPPKKTPIAFASKPRRAIGNTRTLKGAWSATAKFGQPTLSGSEAESVRGTMKPPPIQARRTSPAYPLPSHSTPSPPHQRQASLPLASPASDVSSPPRGLNDVYQRIADEERLAAEEADTEEDLDTDNTMSHDGSVEEDRARLDRIRSSQSPLNLRGSNRGANRGSNKTSNRSTPDAQVSGANKENQSDDTDEAVVTGMSSLENMTDRELAAKLTLRTEDSARDRARLDKAIQKTTPLAFSKAQVGSKHAFGPRNHRQSASKDAGRAPSSSDGSLRDEDSTPPPNVPRGWGSKGRVDRDWLRKIRDRSGNPANGTANVATNGTMRSSPQIDRTAAAADVPLPSVEDSSTPRAEESRNSTPASLSKQTSLDRRRIWELNDFTGNNLSVSNSPPVKVRTNLPDHFRDREIESLEKRAVTTNRLGEIMKKSSSELFVAKSRASSEGAQKKVEEKAARGKTQEILGIEEVGEPIPDTPIVVFKGSANGMKDIAMAKRLSSHNSGDSRESLQRLARAISESPRPSSTPEEWSIIKEEVAGSNTADNGKPERIYDGLRRSSGAEAETNPTPIIKRSQSADAARTPVVTGAWTDTILPDTIKTVKQRRSSKYAQTPHVTGGWVDTPMIAEKKQSPPRAPPPPTEAPEEPETEQTKKEAGDAENANAMTRAAPPLPRSALSSVLDQAKRRLASYHEHRAQSGTERDTDEREDTNNRDTTNDTLNLGDATIESLEDLLTLDNADMTTLIRMGADYEARQRLPGGDDDSPDTGYGTESELLHRLCNRLDSLATNIHDTRKGISKLEHQVSHPPQPHNTTTNPPPSLIKSNPPDRPRCDKCGCPGRPTSTLPPPSLSSALSLFNTTSSSSSPHLTWSRIYLTLPIPRLYHLPQRDKRQWFPRPTALGWLVLLLWLWYAAETVLCRWYHPPEFAEWYTWPDWADGNTHPTFDGGGGGGSGEMRWGWILYGMVWRRVSGGLIWRLSSWVMRMGAWAVGWGDGFVAEALGAGGAGLHHGATNPAASAVGMDADEYL